jgi:TRAP-type C4-dicarboxylate transport system substrate-binding protein
MAVQTGITDMNKLWHPAMPGTFPLMDMFSLAGVMPGQIVVNTQVVNDLYDRWPEFEAQYSEDVEWIYSTVVMGSNIHSREPIRTLDELQGKVISCTSEPAAQALNLLGASATVMTDGAEIYLALERGVIDGAFAAWAWVTGYNLRDVADHHFMIQLSPGSVGYVMRKEAFEMFTPHEQYLLKEYRHQGCYRSNHGAIVGAAMVAQGGIPPDQVYQLSTEDREDVKKLLRPLWDEWIADAEAKGYPAEDILDDCLSLVKGYTSD